MEQQNLKSNEFVKPIIEKSWGEKLAKEFKSDYFKNLKLFLIEEKKKYRIFPEGRFIFNAYNKTPFDKVKVVILGQDPYHGLKQAHGLSFSVQKGIRKPPSLINIFKELKEDINFEIPDDGDLTKWAEQGVFLLNATLTVRESQAGSHQNKGWELFTDATIKILSEEKENLVFMLWGSFAQAKQSIIDTNKHFILKTVHPSPLSVNRGFWGCKHFSKANDFLLSKNIKPIDWSL